MAKVWRAGTSRALTKPSSRAATRVIQRVMAPVATRTPTASDDRGRGGLGDEEEAALVDAIDDDAGEGAEQQQREVLERGGRAEDDARAAELQHEPGERDGLHPGAADREGLADEVAAVVGDRQARRTCGGRRRSCGPSSRRRLIGGGLPGRRRARSGRRRRRGARARRSRRGGRRRPAGRAHRGGGRARRRGRPAARRAARCRPSVISTSATRPSVGSATRATQPSPSSVPTIRLMDGGCTFSMAARAPMVSGPSRCTLARADSWDWVMPEAFWRRRRATRSRARRRRLTSSAGAGCGGGGGHGGSSSVGRSDR